MRSHLYGLAVLSLAAAPSATAAEGAASPPAPKVPAYSPLRFTEDYSYLADPALRSDPFDDLKYIPLREGNPAWYLTLGGEVRERFEAASHPDFGFGGREDSYLLQRLSLYSDFHFGPNFRFYVQGISGTVAGENGSAPPVQDDPLDLQYAFLDVVPWRDGDESLTLRIGRFGMSLGAGRLVATRASPNIPFKFDGLDVLYSSSQWRIESFLARPGAERTNGFDMEDDATTFWGFYATHWWGQSRASGMDLYYLGLRREDSEYASGIATQTRHSLGIRLFGESGGWDYDSEDLVQFGRFGDEDILAWTASLSAGYTWKQAPWQPRLGLKVDIASGDDDPTDGRQGTFDPLFFKSGYFNDASLLRPSNLIDFHPIVSVTPVESLSLSSGIDVFWRYSGRDALYDPPGRIQVPVTSDGSAYVGTALDFNLSWRMKRHAQLAASYVYFFSDNVIRSAGGGSTGFFSTTLTFQF